MLLVRFNVNNIVVFVEVRMILVGMSQMPSIKVVEALITYLKEGFVIVGIKDNFFGDGEPRLQLIMVLR